MIRPSSKPLVRWWWLAGPFEEHDIDRQLEWVKANGFGGVELAWLDPNWLPEPLRKNSRPGWLDARWTALVTHAKRTADRLGLACDFTFGSCWPFGGTAVRPEHSAWTFDGPSQQRVEVSWEDASDGTTRVVNHLSAEALRAYADAIMPAFTPAFAGGRSALFCDSLELVTSNMWSPGLGEAFARQFGYQLEPFTATLEKSPGVLYDYRSFIGETFCREFFQAFTAICHEHGVYSRVQCHGAPADLLEAYSSVDVPESEALLFPPAFSRIAASAAALTEKPLVSAETFTCLHGFPAWHPQAWPYWKKEQPADLKLLADALFSHGVNQIVWHGMPYQPAGAQVEFYASVHVGPDCVLAAELPALNRYLETVGGYLRQGRTYSNVGVYLPLEDAMRMGRIPEEQRTPGANYHWEMRDAVPPVETCGYHPLWISRPFLRNCGVEDGEIVCGPLRFQALYVDVDWLDARSLFEMHRLAAAGARIVMKRRPGNRPGNPGYVQYENWEAVLDSLPVEHDLTDVRPLLTGDDLPPYWARLVDEELLVFFAHPLADAVRYPLKFGQSLSNAAVERRVTIHLPDRMTELRLRFEPNQSLLFRITPSGVVHAFDLDYRPPAPLTSA